MRAPEIEFDDLEALLREDRQAPDPEWARKLDARVSAGFPRKRRWAAWLPSVHIGPAVAVAACGLLALVVAVAALSGDRTDDEPFTGAGGSQSPSIGTPAEESSGREPAPAADDAAGGATTLQRSSVPPVPGDRRAEGQRKRHVEHSAELVLATRPRDVDEVASGVARTATQLGGYVAASSVSSQQGGTLELRVPTARLDRAIEQLSELAKVRDLARQSVDITAQVVSARSRLRDARTERSSLLRQLAEADTVNETQSIRARLRIVSRQIEANKAELRGVKNRANFATLAVTLNADRSVGDGADDEGAWTPGDALRDAVRVLEVVVGVALVALAVALPLGIAALLALLGARVLTRRRRERALDLA
jgi:hypothetical protein